MPVSAPLLFTANDCLDIGTDLGSPVSPDYFENAPFKFNGKIEKVHVKYVGDRYACASAGNLADPVTRFCSIQFM